MKIMTKLIVAGVVACSILATTSAEAYPGHYYGHRHFWHGRWYEPGYYGPDVFVDAPWFFTGWGPEYGTAWRAGWHGGHGGHGGGHGGHGGGHGHHK